MVENANSIPFATTVLIIMAALSALGTLTLREAMGELSNTRLLRPPPAKAVCISPSPRARRRGKNPRAGPRQLGGGGRAWCE